MLVVHTHKLRLFKAQMDETRLSGVNMSTKPL